MQFGERDLNRLSYLVSAIIASPQLYKELIDILLDRGGNEYLMYAITALKQEIEKNNLDLEKTFNDMIAVGSGTPEFHVGVHLRMAYLANPPNKKKFYYSRYDHGK